MKKIVVINFFIALIGFQNSISAQQIEAPNLEFVCELKVTTDKPISLGETAHGIRRMIDITGSRSNRMQVQSGALTESE